MAALETTSPEPFHTEQANFQLLVKDLAWFGIAIPATANFLSVFAILQGATPLELGLLASLPAVFRLLASLITDWWQQRFEDSIKALLWPAFLMRLRVLLFAGVPFLPAHWRVPALIAVTSLTSFPEGITNVVFIVMIREVVRDSRLTALVSRRFLVMHIVIAAVTVTLGLWLERVPFPANYQAMFLGSFGAMMVSLYYVSKVRVLYRTPPRHPAGPRADIHPWRAPEFRRMALAIGGVFVAFFSVAAIIPLQLVNGLGASEGFVALYSLLELVGAAVMSAANDRLTHRFGLRALMVWGMIGTGLATVVLALAPDLPWTLPAAPIAGACWTAANLSQFNYFSLSTPPEKRLSYTRAYFQATTIAMFVGPLLGSTLADSGMSLPLVLMFGAGLRLVAGLLAQAQTSNTATPAAPVISTA